MERPRKNQLDMIIFSLLFSIFSSFNFRMIRSRFCQECYSHLCLSFCASHAMKCRRTYILYLHICAGEPTYLNRRSDILRSNNLDCMGMLDTFYYFFLEINSFPSL